MIVGISGASGTIYGVQLLRMLRDLDVPRYLVMTKSAVLTMSLETNYSVEYVQSLASETYRVGDLAAPISSGSFKNDGMVIAPCSIKTLSAIVNCYEDNLLLRAAGVTLKEGRPLVLVVREAPLHLGQLKLMVGAAEIGARIFPPVPAFYNKPETIADLVQQTCSRVLDQFGIDSQAPRWAGPGRESDAPAMSAAARSAQPAQPARQHPVSAAPRSA
jgi:4-hydroxy-3-polyprenylbenzoate decarboxylase